MATTKQCIRCEKTLPVEDFHKQRGGRYIMSWCKPCHKAYVKQWREDHPERYKAFNEKASLYIGVQYHRARGHRCAECGEFAVRGGKGKPYVCERHLNLEGASS